MKLLTVTVPCYNSQDYMRNCIESLLPGGDRVEIIIIDDGSKDNTGLIADQYAELYPNIVKVVHQENGGHGEGINQGLRHATGKYFKVVDSDDKVNEDFITFLDTLEACEAQGGVDLMVTNYYYVHSDGIGDRSINYSSVLPEHQIFGWSQIGRFRPHQMLTIHSCTFRTDCMRACGQDLPKKTFYEDNLMVCRTLPHVEKLYYLNVDLYRYWIGREGQSVQKDVLMRRYSHQILCTELCFCSFRFDEIENPKLRQYLEHELFLMFGISILYARMNKTREADEAVYRMWETCRAHDRKWAHHYRRRSVLTFLHFPGAMGHHFNDLVHKVCMKVVRYD